MPMCSRAARETACPCFVRLSMKRPAWKSGMRILRRSPGSAKRISSRANGRRRCPWLSARSIVPIAAVTEATKRMACGSSPRSPPLSMPPTSTPPRAITMKPWRWPRNSACAPSSLIATTAWASCTGALARVSRRRSISPQPRRCTERWTCSSGWRRLRRTSPGLELHILVGRGERVARDEPEPRFLHTRPHAAQEGDLPDRRNHHLLVDELLNPVQDRLALLFVQHGCLLTEQPVDLGIAPIGVHSTRCHEGLDPCGRIAEGAAPALDEVPKLLLGVRLEEGRQLEWPELHPDADRSKVVDDGLLDGSDVAEVFARIEAVRIAGLSQKLPRLGGIVEVGRRLPVEVEVAWDDAPSDPGESQGLGVIDGLAVDGVVCGEAYAPVVPRRSRVPLISEVNPEHRLDDLSLERKGRGSPNLFGERAANRVDDVHLTPLQRGQPRRLIGKHLEDQALHTRGLTPVLVEGLQHELNARGERDELVGPGADRRLLEALVAHFLHILPRYDPTGPSGARIEGHEVRPRRLEAEANTPGTPRLDRHDLFFEGLAGRAPVALERELDVLGGNLISVVELDTSADDEFVDESVRRHTPRLGQSRSHRIARHRLHHRIVKRVEDHEGRDNPGGLGWVEPTRSE